MLNKLIIQGSAYTTDNLSDIPLDTTTLGITTTDSHILFNGRYSPYSNFFSRPDLFHDDQDDIAYCSTEQFYQHAKAKHLGNDSVAAEILAETDPATIKHLGEALTGSRDEWVETCRDVMQQGITLKFQQNADLLAHMQSSGSKIHVECNQYDQYWGIGLARTDPQSQDPDQWKGENILGNILDTVRENLIDIS